MQTQKQKYYIQGRVQTTDISHELQKIICGSLSAPQVVVHPKIESIKFVFIWEFVPYGWLRTALVQAVIVDDFLLANLKVRGDIC